MLSGSRDILLVSVNLYELNGYASRPVFTSVNNDGICIRVLKTYRQFTVADWLEVC